MTTTERPKILIVDDDEAFRGLVIRLLAQRGYEVIPARSVRDANALIARQQFVLLIVDYKMPDTDGMTWIEQIRHKGIHTPIAFCSGTWCDQKTFNLLRNILKVSLVLNKPIEPQLFVESIESILPKIHGQGEASEEPSVAESVKSPIDEQYEQILKKFPRSAMAKEELSRIFETVATEEDLLEELLMLRRKLDVEELVNIAKVKYLGELGQLWPALTKHIRTWKDDPKNKNAYENAVGLAHKLRGTAGSFHIDKVAAAATKLENMLQSLDPTDDLSAEVIWSEVFRHLSDGESSIREEREAFGSLSIKENAIQLIPVLCVGRSAVLDSLIASDEMAGACDPVLVTSLDGALATVRNTRFGAVVVAPPLSDDPALLKFCRELRLTTENKNLAMILITTPDQALTNDQLKYAGFSEFLPEYVSPADLVLTIERLSAEQEMYKSRVLVVDDDEVLTSFVSRVLRSHNYSVECLNEPIKVMEVLDQYEPQLLILDVIMPGLTGYDVCRTIRRSDRWRELTVLFLTAKSNQEGRANAFRAGGDDLLSKPVLTEELVARVNTYLQVARLKQAQAEIDPATNVFNRNTFLRRASELFDTNPKNYCLCLFAIDNYDKIGAVHGEFACETVLTTLGRLIRSRYQPGVVKGRWGEKGFALAFANEETDTVIELMELLHDEFSEMQFVGQSGEDFNVTFTTGMTQAPQDGDSFLALRDGAVQRLLDSIHARQAAFQAS